MTESGHVPRVVGMNHVALEVGDIEEALAFYRSILSFTLRGQSDSSAYIDMGDQFIALSRTETSTNSTDNHRHVGLVVDDIQRLRERLEDLDIEPLDKPGLEIRDPWGNRLQFVAYEEIQFTKAEHILSGMGLDHLEKTADAISELREKGLAPPE